MTMANDQTPATTRYDTQGIKALFREAHTNTDNLDDCAQRTIDIFRGLRERGAARLGQVCGIISSEGKGRIETNMRTLDEHTRKLRPWVDFPIYSATDVFHSELELRLRHFPEDKWLAFWRRIIQCGYVTDVFMTPRWEMSRGATDEFRAARLAGLKIHYLGPDGKIIRAARMDGRNAPLPPAKTPP